eukprot:scaffold48964_cov37-Tisochrysis_lutea.AAC.1
MGIGFTSGLSCIMYVISHISQQQMVAVMIRRLVKLRSLERAGENSEPTRATAPIPPKMAVPVTIAVYGSARRGRGGALGEWESMLEENHDERRSPAWHRRRSSCSPSRAPQRPGSGVG